MEAARARLDAQTAAAKRELASLESVRQQLARFKVCGCGARAGFWGVCRVQVYRKWCEWCHVACAAWWFGCQSCRCCGVQAGKLGDGSLTAVSVLLAGAGGFSP